MIEPLARYDEVRPNGRRTFELFKDRLVVESRSARVDKEITIMLADLRPEPNRLHVRPKEFGLGLLLLVASIGLVIFAALGRGPAPPADDKSIVWFSLAGGFFFVALVVLLKTSRKIEFIQFVSHHGNPLLDVAHAGPQRAQFGSFVDTLICQIRANQ